MIAFCARPISASTKWRQQVPLLASLKLCLDAEIEHINSETRLRLGPVLSRASLTKISRPPDIAGMSIFGLI